MVRCAAYGADHAGYVTRAYAERRRAEDLFRRQVERAGNGYAEIETSRMFFRYYITYCCPTNASSSS